MDQGDTEMAENEQKEVIVIGSGVAGMNVVYELMKAELPINITCITKENNYDYSTCGMPYVLEGVVEKFEDIILHKPEFFNREDVKLLINTEATDLDFDNNLVTVTNNEGIVKKLTYDYLVLAVGRVPYRPPIRGIDLEGVHTLMIYDQGKKLQDTMANVTKAVVIGGGAIGLEVAVAFHAKGIDSTVVEVAPTLLPVMLDLDMGKIVEDWLSNKGIKIHINSKVQQIAGADHVEGVILADGTELDTELVLLSTGIRPNIELAKKVGLDIGSAGGIITDVKQCVYKNTQSLGNVFAIGDCVETKNIITGQPVISALASTAILQVKTVVNNILGKSGEHWGTVNPALTTLAGLQVGSVGLNTHMAERHGIPFKAATSIGKSQSRYIPGWKNIHFKFLAQDEMLIGAQIIGEKDVKERINALTLAIRQKISINTLLTTERCYTPPLALLTDPMFSALKQLV